MTKIVITVLLVAGIVAAAHWQEAFAGESIVRLPDRTNQIGVGTLSDSGEVPWLKLQQQKPKSAIPADPDEMTFVPPNFASKFSTSAMNGQPKGARAIAVPDARITVLLR